MAKIYHGCMTKNADGTNRIIGPGEKCLAPTDKCFWKDPEDIKSSGIKTQSRAKKEHAVSNREYDHYLENKKHRRQRISGTETCTMKESDWFYVV